MTPWKHSALNAVLNAIAAVFCALREGAWWHIGAVIFGILAGLAQADMERERLESELRKHNETR